MAADAVEPPGAAAVPARALSAADVRHSLRASIKDGVAWAWMYGAGERYVLPFIVLGRGGLWHMGAFSAVPQLLGAIVQCFAADAVDAVGRRKPFTVGSTAAQALCWVPFCIGIFLPHAIGYWLMLVSFALYTGFANLCQPAWTSLMGDLVPESRRGRFFGVRSGLIGASIMAATLVGGWWITFATDQPRLALFGLPGQTFAFVTLFASAGIVRLISSGYLYQMHEPPYHRHPTDHFSLWAFIRRARRHFGRFVFYCGLLHIGIGFLTPYLPWYLLDLLHFNPLTFAWIGVVNWLALYGSMVLWGRVSDRIGSKRVLAIGGLGTGLTPLLFLLRDDFWWIAAVQAYDGLVFSAYTLSAVNYLLDAVTPPKRARCTAYHALSVAIGLSIGIFAAALVATTVPIPLHVGGLTITRPITLLLIGSAVLRLAPGLLLLGSFAEFRLHRPVFPAVRPSAP